jgi:hypothetical protein
VGSRPEDEDAAAKARAVEDAPAAFLALRRLLRLQEFDAWHEIVGVKG